MNKDLPRYLQKDGMDKKMVFVNTHLLGEKKKEKNTTKTKPCQVSC